MRPYPTSYRWRLYRHFTLMYGELTTLHRMSAVHADEHKIAVAVVVGMLCHEHSGILEFDAAAFRQKTGVAHKVSVSAGCLRSWS